MKKGMKKGMKFLIVGVVFVVIFLMASGVFAETLGLSEDAKKIVNDVAEKRGINESDIQSVEEVNLEDLPAQLDLGEIDTTNIAIYKVDYGTDKPLFVLTASDANIAEYKTPLNEVLKVVLLNFGYNEIMKESSFLRTATGVEGNLEKGYVMMRKGSITGLSTNLEIMSGEGNIEVIVYVNGEEIGFRNTFSGDSLGVKKDYDTQSLGVVKFDKGDIISVYVKTDGNIILKDVINLVEISTE